MKLSYAKKEFKCNQCKFPIVRGQKMATVVFKDRVTKAFISFAYHVDFDGVCCYQEHLIKSWEYAFNKWNGTLIRPKKLGRPPVYDKDTAKKRTRLQSLINYHKRTGNTELELKTRNELEALTKRV
jgi:hypothetical protein